METSSYGDNNSENCILESDIPPHAKTEPCWLGIDEAGRGPVLGPMVYGTCFSPLSMKKQLEDLKFADSKTLTEEQRENIFSRLNESPDIIGWCVHILSPTYISNSMLKRFKYNLNQISHDTAIGLIQRALDRGVKVQEVYVDTVGQPGPYQEKLKQIFPDLDIYVEKKADATYQIVGAASICAKVARDKIVKEWQFQEGLDMGDESFGSGYPSDPATKKFISSKVDNVFGYPQLVRFSWSTASTMLDKLAVPVKWEDEEEEEGEGKRQAPKNTPSLKNFFQVKNDRPIQKRHIFFRDRCLNSVSDF